MSKVVTNYNGFDCSRLRAVMAAKNISNLVLARRMGKSTTTISFWKCGRSRPEGKDLPALGKATGEDFRSYLVS